MKINGHTKLAIKGGWLKHLWDISKYLSIIANLLLGMIGIYFIRVYTTINDFTYWLVSICFLCFMIRPFISELLSNIHFDYNGNDEELEK